MALSQSALRALSSSSDVAQRATPEFEGLVGIGITTQASPGQTIVLEGDPCSHCFRVLTGAVRMYKGTADGRRQLIDFLVAGDCFGLLGAQYTCSSEAITYTTLSKTPRATLAAAVRAQPALAERLIEVAAAELARAHQHMLLLGRKNAQEKVASLLLELARRVGTDQAKPAFRLPLSRQEMADHLGLTIETVSRTMTRLKEEGLIELPMPHAVVLLRPAELATLAEGTARAERIALPDLAWRAAVALTRICRPEARMQAQASIAWPRRYHRPAGMTARCRAGNGLCLQPARCAGPLMFARLAKFPPNQERILRSPRLSAESSGDGSHALSLARTDSCAAVG
jgi:CRP-like cAMP-binding protein